MRVHDTLRGCFFIKLFFVGWFSYAYGGFYTVGAESMLKSSDPWRNVDSRDLERYRTQGRTALDVRKALKNGDKDFVGWEVLAGNLPNLGFTDGRFVRADFTGSKFSQSNFTNANLFEALFLFPDTDLSCVDFTAPVFRADPDFRYVDFTNSIIWQPQFTNANLTGSKNLILCSEYLVCFL